MADSDTADIISYLEVKAGPLVAARYITLFEELYDRLADYPKSGAPRPVLGSDVRISIVPPFVIIYGYNETEDTVIILRIVHGRKKISMKLILKSEAK